MHRPFIRGFTLIELLVVIAIIGILAGIVLASLGSARTKANDSTVKVQMNSMRTAAAETYYLSNNGSYGTAGTNNTTAGANCGTSVGAANSTLFSDTTSNMANLVSKTTTAAGGAANIDCGDSSTGWSVVSTLPSGGYWCVDSTGVARSTTLAGTAYSALIAASGNAAHITAGGGGASGAGATVCN